MEKELNSIKYFSQVPDDELKAMAVFFHEGSIKPGRTLYTAGQSSKELFFIISGEVELRNHNDPTGPEHPLAYLKSGDCVGIGEIFFETYYLNAYAQTPVKFLSISKDIFMENVLTHRAVNMAVLMDFASMTRLSSTFLYNRGARERLLLHLKTLIADQKDMSRVVLDPKISITALAEDLDLTREHVSRVIKGLMKEKILSKVRSRILIDREKLLNQIPF